MIESLLRNPVNPESIRAESEQESEKWEEDFSDLDQIDITETFENRYSEKLNQLKEKSDELQDIQVIKMSELQKLNKEFGGMENAIKGLESEQKLLLAIQKMLNRIIETLNKWGIELDTLSIEEIENIGTKLTKLKAEISETSSNISERIEVLEATQSKLQSIEEEISATNREIGIYEERYKVITDELDEQLKEKNLTNEDKEAIYAHIKTFITELEKTKNLSDEEIVNTIKEIDSVIFKSIENVQIELGNFDVDYEAIFENIAIGAGIGTGVGAIVGGAGATSGAIIGALSGAVGEIARQTALYFGTSEGVAMGVQVVTEVVGGTGLAKVISKEFGEAVFRHSDDIVDGAKQIGKEILDKSDNISSIKRVNMSPLEATIEKNTFQITKIFPKENGKWIGEIGNSTWIPDLKIVPKKPIGNEKAWSEILEKYKIDGIKFKGGEPDFTVVSKGTIEVGEFVENRVLNFTNADEILSKVWSKNKQYGKQWTPQDIKNYRKNNQLTWHERSDMKTLDLVPQEIHGNIPHSGGISVLKKINKT